MSDEVAIKYPVFDRQVKKDNSAIIIIIIIIVILVIVLAVNAYAIFRPQSSLGAGQCEVGLCAVSFATGVKRCPSTATGQVQYNIGFEDCTSANYCQSPKAPCAVLKNGTLDCTGVCGTGNPQCNCYAKSSSVQ